MGDIRLFGVSKLNSSATNNELSEVSMSNSGLITKNTLDVNFNGNEIIAIDNDNIAVIYDNYIDVIDNQWQTVTSFLNISINDVNLFVETVQLIMFLDGNLSSLSQIPLIFLTMLVF